MNLDRAWNRTTAWCHYHATRATDGSLPLADNIAAGIADWIAAGEHLKDKLLRLAAPVGGLLLLLLVTIRPTSLMQWLVVLTLATTVIAGARRGPLVAAAALALLLAASLDPRLLAVIIWVWCWRAVRHAELDELPGLLDHAMGDQDQLRLDHAADTLNEQVGRRAWTPNKLAGRLEALGCPITTPTDKPSKKAKKTEQRHLLATDLDALLDDLTPAPQQEPHRPAQPAPETTAAQAFPAPIEQAPEDPRIALTQWLLTTIGQANGIHLSQLYPLMRSELGQEGATEAALRAALDARGIPITRSMSVGGVDGRSGVRRADLQAHLQALLDEAPLPTESDPSSETKSAPKTGPDLRKSRPLSGRSRGLSVAQEQDESGWIEVRPGHWTRAS